ncbi:hypothetical protein ACH4VR_42095 [Streptomyces sp. NPDC020883]|uniref:golvesin C-terminal-like domain-containing protein n=1 Tax=Streptomyces sp. NPDC020883 TaxID=3365099 RepID=UPI0037B89B7C
MLGKDWHKSQDRAWTTSADAQGFHVLVADQKDAYNWRTAATLREPGFDADMWIGNACVTGSGKRAVVAYAPRTFTNNPELMARGAFTAVVDLDSGDVRKLNRQASLAYFSPGCGTGETAVFTQAGGEDKNATRLIEVDAQAAKMRTPIELEGQVTSAVPVGKDIVAADANRLVKITASGQRSTIAHTEQIPFQLKADAEGGVVYMDRPKAKAGLSPMLRSAAPAPAAGEAQGEVRRVGTQEITAADAKKTKSALLAHGPLAKMDVSSSANGTVFITGQTQPGQALPAPVKRRADVPKESLASTRGEALVTKTAWSDGKDSRITAQEAAAPRPADVDLKVLDTGKQAEFRVTPEEHGTKGADRSPALAAPAGAKGVGAKQATFRATAASGSLDDTAEPQRYCAVPRNDPRKQAMQPKPRQVEWAVDQAITNNLNKHISRPANWKNLGMGAYQPQSLFPLTSLEGGGRVPAQVMLGVTAQESNMWQASRVVVPGVTGNPLIGNYYGIKYAADGQQNDPWGINWDKADCGYGITQVTDGMRLKGKEKKDETALSPLKQEAVALDYTANIAAGVNILIEKWNQTRKDGLTVNNGDPKWMENWFFALWAYNAGYYPKAEASKNGGKWGVGFTNNPANPLWKANRTPFLENAKGKDDYSQAAHPQDWPYQEKVLGWAARPLEALESPGKMLHGFRAAWWNSNEARTAMKPPEGLFCTKDNDCDPSKIGPNDKNEPGLGACTRGDLKCWWNKPVTWKDCTKAQCGNELLRFNDTYKEEADGTAYPPNCSTQGLPGNALVVDDVPDNTPVHRPGCSQPKKNSGTFNLAFGSDSAKIDLQQLGAGYGGHFWFAHTRKDDAQGQRMKVTGTWKLNKAIPEKQAMVLVHLPDHGAQTKQAKYEIKTANGTRTETLNQKIGENRWMSLGAFRFNDTVPEVKLTSVTPDGTGDQDIAYDAVAFVPGNYSLMPDIRFPDADPNAPDPDDRNLPQEIPMPKRTKRSAPVPACRATGGKGNEQVCIELSAVQDAAPKKANQLRSAAPQAAKPFCEAVLGDRSYTRTEACRPMDAQMYLVVNEKLVGKASFRIQQEITLDAGKKEFSEKFLIYPVKIDPTLQFVDLNVQDFCRGGCSTTGENWSRPLRWSPTDTHQSIGTFKHEWTDSGTKDKSNLAIEWALSGRVGQFPLNRIEWSEPSLKIRCDKITKGTKDYNKMGCVFPAYTPTYIVDSAKHPAAAALYWVLMEKLPSHPGSRKHNAPLHYLGPGNRKGENGKDQNNTDNRKVICPSGWNKKYARPEAPESTSCDEYAFAISHESGGMPGGPNKVDSGDQCATLYAVKVAPNDWTLRDHDQFDLPTWHEKCGRALIPTRQNTGAASRIGTIFVPNNRMLDEDPFFVNTPGFEGCTLEELCQIRPRA